MWIWLSWLLPSSKLNRGPIEKVDNIVPVTASSSLALSQDRKIVIWTIGEVFEWHLYDILYEHVGCVCPIGQKFPSKGLETSLQANVHFYDYPTQASSDNSFCVGATSYIDVRESTVCMSATVDIISPLPVVLQNHWLHFEWLWCGHKVYHTVSCL